MGCGTVLQPAQPSDVIIWNVQSGELVHTLRAHAQQVSGVAYSPDGARGWLPPAGTALCVYGTLKRANRSAL